jgi:hypothetical protein
MPLPSDLSAVTVIGQVTRPGEGTNVDPLIGRITFVPDVQQIIDTASGALILGTVTAEPDAAGNFQVTLLAPDSLGITPTGWTYRVEIDLVGIADPDVFHITLTKNNPTVFLTALIPALPDSGDPTGDISLNGNLHIVGNLSVGGTVSLTVPTHAATHHTGGTDALAAVDIGAEVAGAGQAAKDYALGLIPTDWVNVMKAPYNAKGDFVTDDRAAIQAAIDAVQARGGGTVYLPMGTFLLAGALNLPAGDGIQIIGSGWKTVLKVKAAANCYAISMGGGDTRTAVRDLTIDGNGINQTAASGGIYGAGANTCDFEHIRFMNCRDNGLYLGPQTGAVAGFGNRVSRCSFAASGAVTGSGRAIQVDTSHENVITDNRIDSPAGTAVLVNSRRNLISGNTILAPGTSGTAGAASGVHLDTTSLSNVVTDNVFTSSSTAARSRSAVREVTGASGNNISDNTVVTVGTWSVGAFELAGSGSWTDGNIGAGAAGDRSGIINVKNPAYKAAGDGVTDDTAAIQAAITALGSQGGTVFLPPGNYLLNGASPLNLNVPVNLQGAGHGASVIRIGSAFTGTSAITVSSDDCMIQGLQLRGDSSTTTSNPACHGVTATGVQELRVFNTTFQYVNGYALQAFGTAATTLHGGQLDNIKIQSCAGGIYVKSDNTNTAANFQMTNVFTRWLGVTTGANANLDGIRIEDSWDVLCQNIFAWMNATTGGTGVAFRVVGHCAATFVTNLDALGPQTGPANVSIDSNANGSPQNVQISGGVIQQGGVGIAINDAATQIRVDTVRFINNQTHGALVASNATNISFSRCFFYGSGSAATGTNYDINWTGTADGFISECSFATGIVATGTAGVQGSINIGSTGAVVRAMNANFVGSGASSANWVTTNPAQVLTHADAFTTANWQHLGNADYIFAAGQRASFRANAAGNNTIAFNVQGAASSDNARILGDGTLTWGPGDSHPRHHLGAPGDSGRRNV